VPFSQLPVANTDAYTTAEDTPLNIAATGVLGNDLDGGWLLATHALQAVVTTPPSNGTLLLNPNGSLTYTPKLNSNGPDSFSYVANAVDTVSSAILASSTPALVTLNVTAVNDAPLSSNDAYSMLGNRVLTTAAPGVLANDVDAEGSPLSVTLVTAPTHGVLTLNANGSFSYTPTTNYTGVDSFSYSASDGLLSGNVAIATITVNPAANSPPVAVDDFATTTMNTAVAINVLANDTDVNNNINRGSVTITTAPSKGGTTSVNATTGVVTFTPARNFRGTDVFKYRVRDTAGALSNIATVRVNVTR
jgi:VCBS repeat-containing protein